MRNEDAALIRAFEKSPMTASRGDFLTQVYFGEGVTPHIFAQQLPAGAIVVDFASGFSTLGHDVASERSDIQWNNVDAQYTRPLPRQRAAYSRYVQAAPQNVAFWMGNILNISDEMRGQLQGADVVLSYDLLPHLFRISPHLGRLALTNLVSLANHDGGNVYVGPTSRHMLTHQRWEAIRLNGDASFEEVESAAQALESPPWANWYYHSAIRSGVGAYPQKRFAQDGGWNIVFSDDGGQTHYNLAQREGWKLAGRLALGLLGRTS